jgi:hypothetical protein
MAIRSCRSNSVERNLQRMEIEGGLAHMGFVQNWLEVWGVLDKIALIYIGDL